MYKCRKLLPKGELLNCFYDPLISVGIDECLLYNKIEELISDEFKYSIKACPNCDYTNEYITDLSAEYFYSKIELPYILNFEIIFKDYNDDLAKCEDTIPFFKEKLEIFKQIYILKKII